MSNDLYPNTLAPDHEETYELDGVKYTLPATTLVFKQWKGELIKNTFGRKPLIDYEGVPMFAELAIQRIAIKAGWLSRWIETYASKGNSPYYFINWLDTPLTQQVVEPLNDIFQEELIAKIMIQNNKSYSGCWDVLVWKGKRTIFLESKRYKKDSVRNTQLRWLRAGREAGLTTENFLIVQWEFE